MISADSIDSLARLIGEHRESAVVRTLARVDQLVLTIEDGLEEGEPERSFLESKQCGYALAFTDGIVDTIFVYIEPCDGNCAFSGLLVHKLTGRSSRVSIRNALGEPERSGEPQPPGILGPSGAWDRFPYKHICLHFQYTLDGKGLARVTLMSRDRAP